MDRWAKAKSILTSMGSDVNGPTQPKDSYIITRRKIEKRDHEYICHICMSRKLFFKLAISYILSAYSRLWETSCWQISRGFPDMFVILIRTKKHNNGLCTGVSHLGALFNHHVQNNELNGKILMSFFFFFGKMNAVSRSLELALKVDDIPEKIRWFLDS